MWIGCGREVKSDPKRVECVCVCACVRCVFNLRNQKQRVAIYHERAHGVFEGGSSCSAPCTSCGDVSVRRLDSGFRSAEVMQGVDCTSCFGHASGV